ncbi:MAG TPA: hypothetical protein VIF37_19910 [Methylobacter sp.]
MKKMMMVGFTMVFASSTAMAHGYPYGYNYGYNQYDAMADYQVSAVNAQERADVMHELQESDFREAQQVIQRDEAIKYQIRQDEALYNQNRNMNRYGYGYYGDD